MTAAIYARVSTTDQDCDMQLSELRRYAEAQGFTIHKEYVDTGFSGKSANRPALKACMADALKRRFDILLVWKLDRWGRTVAQLSTDILSLDAAGIRFICPSQGIDTDASNPVARLFLHLLAAFAEFERAIIVDRVNAGVRQYRADYKAGRIGKTKHSKSGLDLPMGRPAKVFNRQTVIDMRAAGKSWNEIVAETGLPKTTIRRVLA